MCASTISKRALDYANAKPVTADGSYKQRPGFHCYLVVRPQAHEHRPPTGRAAGPDRPGERQDKPRGASRPCRIKRVEKNRDTKDRVCNFNEAAKRHKPSIYPPLPNRRARRPVAQREAPGPSRPFLSPPVLRNRAKRSERSGTWGRLSGKRARASQRWTISGAKPGALLVPLPWRTSCDHIWPKFGGCHRKFLLSIHGSAVATSISIP